MYRSSLSLIAVICISQNVFSQADIPVDPLTGKAQVVLPIWTLTHGSLSVPIAVSYNGGGVRVSESEGTAGQGWNLVAGGSVTRELRGLPDEYDISGDTRKGWLTSSFRTSLSSFAPTANTGCADWTAFSPYTSLSDTEPDVFNVNAPGLSVRFIFDHAGTIRTMPYQDVKITYTTSTAGGVNKIISFVVTDNKGFKYTFNNVIETTLNPWGAITFNQFGRDYGLLGGTPEYNSGWQLASIEGPYGELASFTYGATEVTQGQQRIRTYDLSTGVLSDKYLLSSVNKRAPLTTITVGSMAANLTWASYGGVISTINISVLNESKVFNFSYNAVFGTTEEGQINGIAGVRNYLSKITQESSCDAYPAYSFEYYSPEALPYQHKYPVDFFGYFNNQTGSDEQGSLKPPVYQNDAAADGERFRIYNKTGYTAVSSSTYRNVNPSTVYYGSLKKVNYPSGGSAEITWQPNEYYDDAVSANQYGAGVRVASVKISDGDTDTSNDIIRNYEYKKSDGTSSGRWLYMPCFAFADGTGVYASPDNLAPDQTMYYERATVIFPGSGKTVYEYLVPGRYPQVATSDWNATRTRLVSPASGSCPSQGNLQSGFYIYPFAYNTNYDFEQGLVSKIQHYNEAGTLVKEQNYSYQRLNPGTVTIKGMKLEQANVPSTTYAYGLYSLMANVGKTVQTESVTNYDLVTPTSQTVATNYVYNSNQYLAEVNTVNSDGTTLKTQYKYANDLNPSNPSGSYATMLQKLNTLNMKSVVIEAVNYQNTTVTGAALTLYDDVMGTTVPYVKQVLAYKGTGTLTAAALSGSPQAFTYDNSNYFAATTFEEYGTAGMPVTVIGQSRVPVSTLYLTSSALPAATFSNARVKETLFSDFENVYSYQIATSNSTDAWSGTGAYQLTSGVAISKSGIVKSTTSARYRFRCRAKATTASNITLTAELSNGSGGWIAFPGMTYSASGSGKWQLLEGFVAMTGVASLFTLRITANANLVIDDVLLAPEAAAAQTFTYLPATGKTSETDARGFSNFFEYDALGKLTYEKNTDKDIVRAHEYRYKVQPAPQPKSSFTCTGCGYLYSGNAITLTATTNCMSPLSYEWKVDGTVVGNAASLTYTFGSAREYAVQLTVAHATYGSSSTVETFTVNPQPLTATISGDQSDIQCGGSTVRAMTLAVSGCYSTQGLTCNWYFKKDAGNWILVQSTSTVSDLTFDCFSQGVVNTGVQFKVEIIGRCTNGSFNAPVSVESAPFAINLASNYHPCPN